MRKLFKSKMFIIIMILLVFVTYLCIDNVSLVVSNYYIELEPKSKKNFTIVQISDLHNASFGKGNINLINRVRVIKPDIIAITGDIIDSRKEGLEHAISFLKGACSIAPVYFVKGNHEEASKETSTLLEKMKLLSINILDNKTIIINEDISLSGISDPICYEDYYGENTILESTLHNLMSASKKRIKILLSHRPELLDIYQRAGADIVLSGHAHGGQIRLPLLGGLYAPSQGFLPKYYQGIYKKETTQMVVSRGLGNSVIPLRVFNTPEIVTITIRY